ncbi:MAG: LysM peptidoglycan-binding domain-containing protein [Balneolales bacterium]
MKNKKNSSHKYFITFIILVISAFTVQAQEKHTVRSGETLYGISRTYNISVSDIQEWNGFNGTAVAIDQVLIVSDPDPDQETTYNRSSEEFELHTVESGETLFAISRLYDVSVGNIREWNNLENDNLKEGQQLKLSEEAVVDKRSPVNETTVGGDITQPVRPSQGYHEVGRGETLYRISRQYDMSVPELQELNNIEGTQLKIGQRLIVNAQRPENANRNNPDDAVAESTREEVESAEADSSTPFGAFDIHVMGENETVEALISRHGMDREEFVSLNPRFESESIEPGDSVKVLKTATSTQDNPYSVSSNLDKGDDISVTVYDPQHKGNTTTSGALYNPGHFTAAHSSLRLGRVVYIENPSNGKGIFVQINDRVTGNFLQLSAAAFNALGFEESNELAAEIFEQIPE